ncbi:hypothetical protein ACLMJK_008289 [Lecanora helva]
MSQNHMFEPEHVRWKRRQYQNASVAETYHPHSQLDAPPSYQVANWQQNLTFPIDSSQAIDDILCDHSSRTTQQPCLPDSPYRVEKSFGSSSSFNALGNYGQINPTESLPTIPLDDQPQQLTANQPFQSYERMLSLQYHPLMPLASSHIYGREPVLGLEDVAFNQNFPTSSVAHLSRPHHCQNMTAIDDTLSYDEPSTQPGLPLYLPATPAKSLVPLPSQRPVLESSPSSQTSTVKERSRSQTVLKIAGDPSLEIGAGQHDAPNSSMAVVDNNVRKVFRDHESGKIQGTCLEISTGKRQPTRKPLSDAAKKQANKVRESGGPCSRCKRLKQRCEIPDNPYEPCAGCKERKKVRGIARMPCFQSKVTDALFFRSRPLQDSPLDQKRKAVYELNDFSKTSATRTLKLMQGDIEVNVHVAKYEPTRLDKTAYEWNTKAGDKHRLHMPHYCLTNIEVVRDNLHTYSKQTRDTYLVELSESHPIIKLSVDAALTHSKRHKDGIVSHALDMWSATRMVEKSWQIVGEDTLGMKTVVDTESPLYNMIPVTPIMNTQLDQIVIQHILEPLRQSILEELNLKVEKGDPRDFYEIYLTIFILLCSIERNAFAQIAFAKRYRFGRKFSNPRLLESYCHAAKILLSRFHFVCQGSAAMQSNWTDEKVKKFAALDKEESMFMESTRSLITEHSTQVKSLQYAKDYDRPLYWCHQLYFPNWHHGGPTHVSDD